MTGNSVNPCYNAGMCEQRTTPRWKLWAIVIIGGVGYFAAAFGWEIYMKPPDPDPPLLQRVLKAFGVIK